MRRTPYVKEYKCKIQEHNCKEQDLNALLEEEQGQLREAERKLLQAKREAHIRRSQLREELAIDQEPRPQSATTNEREVNAQVEGGTATSPPRPEHVEAG